MDLVFPDVTKRSGKGYLQTNRN